MRKFTLYSSIWKTTVFAFSVYRKHGGQKRLTIVRMGIASYVQGKTRRRKVILVSVLSSVRNVLIYCGGFCSIPAGWQVSNSKMLVVSLHLLRLTLHIIFIRMIHDRTSMNLGWAYARAFALDSRRLPSDTIKRATLYGSPIKQSYT